MSVLLSKCIHLDMRTNENKYSKSQRGEEKDGQKDGTETSSLSEELLTFLVF